MICQNLGIDIMDQILFPLFLLITLMIIGFTSIILLILGIKEVSKK